MNADIDVGVDRFATDAAAKVPALMFSNPSFIMNDAFPCDSRESTEEPIFSQSQVRRLMEIVASKCGEALANGLARANNETS